MSGWTCITLEPGRVDEENLPSAEEVDELHDLFVSAADAHDKQSAGDLKHYLEEIRDKADELASLTGEVNAEERIIDYLEDEWKTSRGNSPVVDWANTPTFIHPQRSVASYTEGEPQGQSVAEGLFEDCPYVQRILIISANDTSDSGAGELYKRDGDGGAVLVDHWVGYEAAHGQDVRGHFREEHNISGVAQPY